MRAIQVTSLDGPRAVTLDEVDEPLPSEDAVIVDVHAAGVTYPDVLLTRGQYQLKPELPFSPGLEVAGTVRSAPENSPLREGDRVAGLSMFGGFAEQVAVPADHVFPLPDGVEFAAAAALPVNYFTAEFALTHRAGLAEGDTVLVHGAAGGVGTASIQYARARGATVVAVASTDEKAALATEVGAHHTVHPDGFAAAAKELTGGRGVDIVVDPVGGDRFTDSLRSLAADGRLLVVGFVGGEIPTVKVNRLLLNNTGVIGVAWGAYALVRPGFVRRQWDELTPLIADGTLRAPLGLRVPLADAAEALAAMEERRAVGKVVVDVR